MVGETISRYKILRKIGEGGMGVVYRAEDTKLERSVALKFLPNHLLGNTEVKRRFEREAKAAAALDHANVCTVYEVDEADGKTFIAMSLIEGESLDQRIARGPLKLGEAIDIARQIAEGTLELRRWTAEDLKSHSMPKDSKVSPINLDLLQRRLERAQEEARRFWRR